MTAFYKFTDTTGRYYPSLEINVTTNDVVDFASLGGSPPDPDRWTTSTGPATVAPGSGYTYPGGAATSPAPLLGPWVPNVAYVANQAVMSPSGTVVTRLSGGTSRATFDATEAAQWTASGSGAYLPKPTVALTSGQLYGGDGSGNTVAVNPTGNAQLAYAENVTGTAQTGIANTATDVTACSISVPASTRPVYLHGSACIINISGGGTDKIVTLTILEVSNGVDTVVTIQALAPLPGTAYTTVTIPPTRLAASTARTRTFKLQVNTSSAATTCQVFNGATGRSLIAAEAR